MSSEERFYDDIQAQEILRLAAGYSANRLARNLRTAESRLLLTMVPDFSNPFSP